MAQTSILRASSWSTRSWTWARPLNWAKRYHLYFLSPPDKGFGGLWWSPISVFVKWTPELTGPDLGHEKLTTWFPERTPDGGCGHKWGLQYTGPKSGPTLPDWNEHGNRGKEQSFFVFLTSQRPSDPNNPRRSKLHLKRVAIRPIFLGRWGLLTGLTGFLTQVNAKPIAVRSVFVVVFSFQIALLCAN